MIGQNSLATCVRVSSLLSLLTGDEMKQKSSVREGKRAKFAQSSSTSKPKPAAAVWLFAGGILLAITVLVWFGTRSGATGVVDAGAAGTRDGGELPVRDGAVRLPVSTFDDGKARWYTYHADGVDIQFFVLKSSDGVIRAAFNACDVCFLEKKGYSQEGDEMVCNNCGQRFPSELINEVRGGCNPSPLERTIQDGQVVILIDDILTGAGYF
jgi:hypothetical protein